MLRIGWGRIISPEQSYLGGRMDTKIVLIYCICSDFLREESFLQKDSQRMSSCEVLTFAIVSGLFFYGNHERTRLFLYDYNYIPNILSKSQLNRRLHAFEEEFWKRLLYKLSRSLHHYEKTHEYAIDSFPVKACENSRITRAKILQGKEFHGYTASKQSYFFGAKVHMIVNLTKGIPVEVVFTPGSENDLKAFRRFCLDIPKGSIIYGDRAYNDYKFEDFLRDHQEIHLIAQRRTNSKRPLAKEVCYIQSRMRKRIETVFSQITQLFPKNIHAVTSKGFYLKIFNFILAYLFTLIFKEKLSLV
tara:strand:+ start:120 stop:1028 length:909 start_codon:yes stop_codon:yes gene_type:complete